jgi:hypothetical protein
MPTEYLQFAMVNYTSLARVFHSTHCSSSTDRTAPYCYGYTYPQLTATNYICDTTFNTEWETVLTSFNGDTAGHSWTPQYEDNSANPTTTPRIPDPATPTPTPHHHHVPVGAIAGGVIGGLLIIGAIICAVLFLCLRKRKQHNNGVNSHNNANNAMASEYNGPAQNIQVIDTKSQLQSPYSPQTQHVDNRGSFYPTSPQQQFAQQQYTSDPMLSPRTSIVPPYSPQSPPPAFPHREVSPPPVNMMTTNQVPVQIAESAIIPQVNKEGNRVYEAQG